MGAPLILTKNRNNSPENLNPTPVEEPTITTTTQSEISEHEEDNAVNGKLDISIKDNSIYNKSGNNTRRYQQLNEFKHNYHWFVDLWNAYRHTYIHICQTLNTAHKLLNNVLSSRLIES